MALTQEIIDEIISVSQRLINALTVYLGQASTESVGISRFQLVGDLHKVVATSLAITDILKSLMDITDVTLDERLNDWLISREPATCREVLKAMAVIVGVNHEDKTIWRWLPMPPFAPSQAKVKQAVTLFNTCRSHFHFLLTTDAWNLEKQWLGFNAKVNIIELVTNETPTFSSVLGEIPMTIDTHEGSGITRNAKEVDWKELEEILQWLNGLNCTEKHEDTLDLRQDGTCMWLPNTNIYKAWRHGDYSFLWLHGKLGAGKSVLAASVIDDIHHSLANGEFLAYFYCDFRSERTTDSAEVMRSLLSQLLNIFFDGNVDPGDVLCTILKEKRQSGSILKSAKRLAQLVASAARQFIRKPLIIIDALDECRDTPNLLDALITLTQANLQLFVTSRPLPLIKDRFINLPSLSLDSVSTAVSADIQLHVICEIDAHRRLRIAPAKLKAEIRSSLCEKADGMFRWIQCQLDNLKQCVTPLDIREALENLPNGLEETYNRILLAIDKHEHEAEAARRALTWLIATFSRLRLSEIMEALSIDLGQRILNPELAPMHGQALLDALSSLVMHDEETDIVILSHFSVQEYLTGELPRPKLSTYRIDPRFAEAQLAEFCMCYIAAYLNHRHGSTPSSRLSDGNIDRTMLSGTLGGYGITNPPPESEAHPLLQYLLSHAFDHLSLVYSGDIIVLKALQDLEKDVKRNPSVWDQMCRKRSASGPAWPSSKDDIALYILIAYADESFLRFFLGPDRVKPKVGGNALVYAAQLDKVGHAKILLSRGAAPNQSGQFARRTRQVTPIEAAVCHQSRFIVEMLLMKGVAVPSNVFVDVFKARISGRFDMQIVARLLQTDHFVEWAVEVQDDFPSFNSLHEWVWEGHDLDPRPDDEDVVTILRRLVQVDRGPFGNEDTQRKFFLWAAANGYISTLRYMLSVDIPLPPGILQDMLAKADMSGPMLQLLIDHEVDLHAVTAEEKTMLHAAVNLDIPEEQCLERVKLLFDAGVDPSAYDLYGETALTRAAMYGFVSVIQFLHSVSTCLPPDILLACGPQSGNGSTAQVMNYLLRTDITDAHAVAPNGDTALHVALHPSRIHSRSDTNSENCLESIQILLKAGCNPSLVNSVGDTPLDVALWTGHVSVVEHFLSLNLPLPPDALLRASSIPEPSPDALKLIKILLRKGVDVNVVSPNGNNAIHIAIQSTFVPSHVESMVKMLVGAGCNPSVHNAAEQTPLHLAVKYEHKSTVAYLLSLGLQLPRDILFFATSVELFDNLIERGVDPRTTFKNGDTLLHRVVSGIGAPVSDALRLAKFKALVQRGCDPSMSNPAGETPFHIAVRNAYAPIVEYLLPFNIPLPSDILLVAFHPRCPRRKSQRLQIVRFLAGKGADTAIITEKGDSLLHLALSSHFFAEDDALQAAKILVGARCVPHTRNFLGETAFHAAARAGYKSSMEYLICLGVPFDPNVLLAQARVSADGDKASIMRWLISKGANIHAVTSTGDTVLHLTLACHLEKIRLETAQLLIELGCDASRSNQAGETPLHVAARSGFPSLLKLILRSQNAPRPLPPDILLAAVSALDIVHIGPSMWIAPRMEPTFNLLIREGAIVNAVAQNGETLLHIVVRQGLKTKPGPSDRVRVWVTIKWGLMVTLLRAGCDPFARDANGRTPFDLAQEKGYFFHNNFLRLVNEHYPERSRATVERSTLKRRAEEMNKEMETDVVGRLAKRGRWDDDGDEDEIAEVEGQLVAY